MTLPFGPTQGLIAKPGTHQSLFRRAAASVVLVLAIACGAFAWGTPNACAGPQIEPRGDEFESLFDGQTLQGWSGDEKIWSVQDGAITGQTTADKPLDANTFLIWQGGDLGDFELRIKFRIEAGNSGVQYRSQDLGDHHVGGYQADIDATNQYTGILYDERGRGILANRTQRVQIDEKGEKKTGDPTCDEKKLLASIKPGDWNEYVITARGNHLTQAINGHVTIDVTDQQTDQAEAKGILALQIHAGPPMKVQFKDVRLKRISEPGPAKKKVDE